MHQAHYAPNSVVFASSPQTPGIRIYATPTFVDQLELPVGIDLGWADPGLEEWQGRGQRPSGGLGGHRVKCSLGALRDVTVLVEHLLAD